MRGPVGAAKRASLQPDVDKIAEAKAAPIETGVRLLPLRAGFYGFSLVAPGRSDGQTTGVSFPAVHICTAPRSADLRIASLSGRSDPWLVRSQHLFVTAPPGGSTALLTGYRGPGSTEAEPIEIEVRRLDQGRSSDVLQENVRGETPALLDGGTLVLGLVPDRDPGQAGTSLFEAVAAIRGEGEVRFVDTEWIGRLGRGRWIESFTLVAHVALPAGAVECKGLTADGEETAWTVSGTACGVAGANMPLVGFSVRQRPASGPPLFDCEYRGCFQSGTTAGPARNGAPCLSAAANDPLEGLRIRIIPRSPRPASR